MKQDEFDIDESYGPEYKGHYIARQIPLAVHDEIIEKYTDYNHETGKVLKINHTAIGMEFIIASLKQPPSKPVTLEKLMSHDIETCVPPDLADFLKKKVNAIINVSLEERKNS